MKHNDYHVYYYHPLDLTFTSAQTILIFKFYGALAKAGWKVGIYGTYRDKQEFVKLKAQADALGLHLTASPKQPAARFRSKMRFIWRMMCDSSPKVLVTRNHQKSAESLRVKLLLRRSIHVQEMHVEAFPYRMKPLGEEFQRWFFRLMQRLDGVIFLTEAQRKMFEEDSGALPRHDVILPSGADASLYAGLCKEPSHVVTYIGQLNDWKNVPLLFAALAHLPEPYRLRIAGGKGDAASQRYIDELCERFGVHGRVEYLGFVAPDRITEDVIAGSEVLALPLGDNLPSKVFTSPVKLFEYLATDIPIVAVDYPTIRDLADERALTLAPNDPEAFAQAILRAAGDLELESKIAQRQILRKRYGTAQRIENFDRFIREVLQQQA